MALDVLEHTDDIYRSFSELCRVAHSHVLIVLPNVYEIKGRARFLFGRRLSGKYGLPQDPPSDRHRWLFSLPEAVNFAHTMGQRCGFEVVDEGCLIGPWRSVMGVCQLVSFFPNLLSPSYVALLHRKETNESKQWNIQLH